MDWNWTDHTVRHKPPGMLSKLNCYCRRGLSFLFTFSFLGSLMTASIVMDVYDRVKAVFRPSPPRPFAELERTRIKTRTEAEKKVVNDIDYYARLAGLRALPHDVVTDDGFVLQLFRVTDPNVQETSSRYPVLLVHGLLQSAGAFCVNENDSLAFQLCKSGYDVWLGNNRCGFNYKHVEYAYNDPRMWNWDVVDMGTRDIPAFVDYILHHTGHSKLGLVGHSQGTTQAFLVLSKFYTPDLGNKISGFCALAPAVYAGPLVDRPMFKFIRYIPPFLYRLFFGIHAFIPSMLTLRRAIPKSALTYCSYAMFHFLFHWSDTRWDRALEGRMFQFSPVYVSAESMRWWLGRGGFASRRCIFTDDTVSWFDARCPPMAFWIAQKDSLVDGVKLMERIKTSEPDVVVMRQVVVPEYEHLDVLWAADANERVNNGVKEVLWATAYDRSRFQCPTGCEDV
ncbi:Alpha/Beta hydrolase protein [Lipomyces arxii]|uniref:Alpha/Beta hydrolase protein n=1 Tax=Lipomyces arxii TaxID=56418 RepID=UPI0034CDBD6B